MNDRVRMVSTYLIILIIATGISCADETGDSLFSSGLAAVTDPNTSLDNEVSFVGGNDTRTGGTGEIMTSPATRPSGRPDLTGFSLVSDGTAPEGGSDTAENLTLLDERVRSVLSGYSGSAGQAAPPLDGFIIINRMETKNDTTIIQDKIEKQGLFTATMPINRSVPRSPAGEPPDRTVSSEGSLSQSGPLVETRENISTLEKQLASLIAGNGSAPDASAALPISFTPVTASVIQSSYSPDAQEIAAIEELFRSRMTKNPKKIKTPSYVSPGTQSIAGRTNNYTDTALKLTKKTSVSSTRPILQNRSGKEQAGTSTALGGTTSLNHTHVTNATSSGDNPALSLHQEDYQGKSLDGTTILNQNSTGGRSGKASYWGTIGFDELVEGSLNPVNEPDYYTFNGYAGDIVLARMKSYGYIPRLSIMEGCPYTVEGSGEISWQLPSTGTYTLMVENTDPENPEITDAPYSLYLTRLNPPSPSIPITPGETVSGTCTRPLEMIFYDFEAHEGDQLTVTMTSDCAELRLYSVMGDWIPFSDPYTQIPSEGTYYLAVAMFPDSFTLPGPYSFTTNLSAWAPGDSPVIPFNTTLSGSFNATHIYDLFSFNLSTAETVFVRVYSPDCPTRITLLDGDGHYIGLSDQEMIYPHLGLNGTFYLLVNPLYSGNVGNYSVYLEKIRPPGNAPSFQYGDIVSGCFSQELEIQKFTLNASEGDSIRVWAADNSGGYSFRLFSPSGAMVSIGNPTVVSETGRYTLLVTLNGGRSPGPFGFSVQSINRGSTLAPIQYGQVINGNITNPLQMDTFAFNATVDDLVVARLIQTPASGPNSRVTLFRPDGTYITSATGTNPNGLSIQVLSNGTYYLSVSPLSSSDQVFSYRLYLQNRVIATTEKVLHGSILVAGETERFRFSGEAGDFIAARAWAEGGFWPKISIRWPNDTRYSRWSDNPRWGGGPYTDFYYVSPQIAQTGQYYLKFEDYYGTHIGNFTIYFLTINRSTTTPLIFNQWVKVPFSGSTQIVAYNIQVEDQDSLFWIENSSYVYHDFHDLSGQIIAGINAPHYPENPLVLPSPGTYYLTCTPLNTLDPAFVPQDYLYIDSVRHPTSVIPIQYNGIYQGTSANQVWQNFFSFNGTAGDRVLARTSSNKDVTSKMYLYNAANGSNIVTTGSSLSSITEIQGELPENATYYYVRTDHTDYNTISYTTFITKLNPPPNATPINVGDVVSGNFTRPLEAIPYAYSANAGDTIRASYLGSGWQLRLFSPEGDEITIRDPTTLLTAGTYHFMVARDANAATTAYSFVVESFTGPSVFTPIAYNQTIGGSIDTTVEMDFFSFNGTAGERIDARVQSAWTNSPRLSLYRRNGTSVLASAYGSTSSEISVLLPENDTYFLVVDDREHAATGSYSVYLTRLNPPPVSTPAVCGLVVSGNTTQALELVPYALAANPGDVFRFWLNSSCSQARLYAPDGTAVTIQDPTVLPGEGTYHFALAQKPNVLPGPYRFYIESVNRVPPENAHPIGYGETVSGNLTLSSRPHFFNFTGSVGETILSRLTVSTSGARLQIHAANGSILRTGRTFGKWADINYSLPLDGEYYLSVDDVGGTDVCSYALCLQRLQSPVNATVLPDYAVVDGILHTTGEFDSYSFVADADDYLYASMTYPLHTTFLRVYQPNGTLLSDASGGYQSSLISRRLPVSGQYTLVAGDNTGESFANYTLTFQNSRPQPLLVGKNLSRISRTSLWDTYTLDTPAGEDLLVRMTPARAGEGIEIYAAFNRIPTESNYDYVQKFAGPQGSYDLLIPTVAGRYYIGVFGRSLTGPLPYNITASMGESCVSSVYPETLTRSADAVLNIYGLGFENNMQVGLVANNSTTLSPHVFLSSQTVLVARFDLTSVPAGVYDLVVSWPGGSKVVTLPSMVNVLTMAPGVILEVPDVNVSPFQTKQFPITVPACQNLFISLQKVNFPGHDTHNGWVGNLSVIRNGEVIAYDRSELLPILIGSGGGAGTEVVPEIRYSNQDLFLQLVNPEPGVYTIEVTSLESAYYGYRGGGTGILTARTALPELPDDQWTVNTIHRNWGSSFQQVDVKPGTASLVIDTESTGDWSYFRLYRERFRTNRDEMGRQSSWSCFGGPTSRFTLPNPDPGLYIMEFVDTGGVTHLSGVNWSERKEAFISGERDILLKATMSGQSDPPIRYFPTITRFTPKTGGNSGPVTLILSGRWLDPAAVVTLTGSDNTPILASEVKGSDDNTTLVALFDLQGRAPGDYTLLVTNPDGSTVNGPFPFTLVAGGKADFWARIVGREAIRNGKPSTYRMEYGNQGSIDMRSVPVGISSEPGLLQLKFSGSDEWISTSIKPVVMAEGPASSPHILPAGFSSSIDFQVITELTGKNQLVAVPYLPESTEPSEVEDRTDVYCPENGLPLEFSSSYPGTASSYIGPFGYGWVHTYDLILQEFENGHFGVRKGDQFIDIISRISDGNYSGYNGYVEFTRNPDQTTVITYPDKSSIKFHADGYPDYYQDLNGNRISFEYSSKRLTKVRHSSGDTLSFEYLPSGRISQVTDPAHRVTQYSYDPNGTALISVTTADGRTTEYSYEMQNGICALKDVRYPGGFRKIITSEETGVLREISLKSTDETLSFSHDLSNRTTRITDLAGSWISIHKDEGGRLKTLRNCMGSGFTLQYDEKNNPVKLTGPTGQTSSYEYDSYGNTLRVMNPLNDVTTFTYDLRFNALSSARDPRGNQVAFSYDPVGNPTTVTYQDGSTETFGYDSSGKVLQVTNRNGATTHYTYNPRGLLTRKDFPGGSYAAYSYDEYNNLISAADENGTVNFLYDPSNRLTAVIYPGGYAHFYTYDERGLLTGRSDQDGFVLNYTYTDTGRLARVNDGSGNLVAGYTYDYAGKLKRKDLGSGAFSSYEYNDGGLLTHQVNFDPQHVEVSDYLMDYDLSGNLISLDTEEGHHAFEYDSSGQLTRITWPDGHSTSYQYDAAGNRISTTNAGNTTFYTTNLMDQYTAIGDDTLSYDQNGNLVSVSQGGSPASTTQYTYGNENQLLTITDPDGTWEYHYDALGNRIGMTHNGTMIRYLYDPLGLGDITAEYNSSGYLLTRYLYGSGLLAREDSNGNRSYYQFSPGGHTSEITSRTGVVVNQYKYAPFGEKLMAVEGIANPFTYAGEFGAMDDGNGLIHMDKRFYSPAAGRFTTIDPVFQPGANPYTYCQNNPVIKIDPQGRLFWFIAIGAGIGYGAYKAYGWVKDWLDKKDVAKLPDPEDTAIEVIKNIGDPDIMKPGTPKSPNPLAPIVDVPTQLLTIPTSLGDNPQEVRDNARNYGHGVEVLVKRGKYLQDIDRKIRQNIDARESRDPEDKYGPGGYDAPGVIPGEEMRFIKGTDALEYQAYFWNHENATAPVCDVDVFDVMDPDLDLSSFRFTEAGFTDWHVPLDPCQYFMVYVDTRPKMDYIVRIVGIYNQTTGVANLTYSTLDPITMMTPEDPLAGFLPKISESGKEIGWFNYLVFPTGSSATGTEITNQAFINFDNTTFLPGPKDAPWKNTIDSGAPSSSLAAAVEGTNQVRFTATLNDDPGGSGVRDYTVYISDNGGGYLPWLNHINGTVQHVTGIPGHTYRYYSIARDNVGNTEGTKVAPDGTITVPLPAIADFAASPLSGPTPLDVNFTDLSASDPTSWQWNFGDGSANASVQHPNHTFMAPGNYTITLTARNAAGGSTLSKAEYIHATEPTGLPLAASFTAIPAGGYAPLTVRFNDTSTGSIVAWNWSWNAGANWTNTTDPLQRNISHTFGTTGTHTVILEVRDGAARVDRADRTITVLQPTFSISSVTPAKGTVGGTVSETIVGINLSASPVPGVNLTKGSEVITATNVKVSGTMKIMCKFAIPLGATTGAWDIQITKPGGETVTMANAFMVNPLPAPKISSVSPTSGFTNSTNAFSLAGTNFIPGSTVTFSRPGYSIGAVTDPITKSTKLSGNLTLNASVPTGKWSIRLTLPDGRNTTKADAFMVNPWPKPVFTRIFPGSGNPNMTYVFTLTGNYFKNPDTVVTLTRGGPGENIPTILTSVSQKKITGSFSIPSGASIGKWNVTITTPDGGSFTKKDAFEVKRWPTPTIASITPTSGLHGTTVAFIMTGNNFQPGSSVNLTTIAVPGVNMTTSLTSLSQKKITGTLSIPSDRTGKFSLEVECPDGSRAVKSGAFTVT